MSSTPSPRSGVDGSALSAPHIHQPLEYFTLAVLAGHLGKGNARAARDWCQRHGIRYFRDGKYSWVLIDDVRRAIERLPLSGATNANARESAAMAAVAALTRSR